MNRKITKSVSTTHFCNNCAIIDLKEGVFIQSDQFDVNTLKAAPEMLTILKELVDFLDYIKRITKDDTNSIKWGEEGSPEQARKLLTKLS